MGLDLGDGVLRHPLAFYEIIFLTLLFILFSLSALAKSWGNGIQFKVLMLSYFALRFGLEFLKPNTFFILNFSSIQWLCMLCWGYYFKSIVEFIHYARKKLHLL